MKSTYTLGLATFLLMNVNHWLLPDLAQLPKCLELSSSLQGWSQFGQFGADGEQILDTWKLP